MNTTILFPTGNIHIRSEIYRQITEQLQMNPLDNALNSQMSLWEGQGYAYAAN